MKEHPWSAVPAQSAPIERCENCGALRNIGANSTLACYKPYPLGHKWNPFPAIPPTQICEHCGKDENCHTNANRFCTEYGRVLAPLKRFKPIPPTPEPICHACGYRKTVCQYPNNQAEYPHDFEPKPIPPTSAPWSEGGLVSDDDAYRRGLEKALEICKAQLEPVSEAFPDPSFNIAVETCLCAINKAIRALAKGESK